MGRRFTTGSNERIIVGTAAALAGFDFRYGTIAVVVNIVSFVDGAMFSVNKETGASVDFATGGGGADIYWYDGTNARLGPLPTVGVTYVMAATKATGTALPRFHTWQPSTNVWTHTDANGTSPDSAAVTFMGIGSSDDAAAQNPLNAELFAVAAWNKVVMTDSQVERLSRGRWAEQEPDFLAEFAHGRDVGDMTSSIGRYGVKQSARTGTTRGTAKPPPGFRFAINTRRR